MLTNPQVFIWLLLITATIYWVTPARLFRLRAWILIITSSIFIFSVAPYAALGVILTTITIVIVSKCCVGQEDPTKTVFVSIICLLFAFSFARYMSNDLGALITLGLTFSLLRAVALLVNSVRTSTSLTTTDALFFMLFFPLYSSGPIENVDLLNSSQLSNRFSSRIFVRGLMRIAFGLFKVLFIASELVDPWVSSLGDHVYTDVYSGGFIGVLIFSLVSLLFVYLNFSGYSDIAIGSGAVYGLRVRENFNFPFLAKNIIEFWQRWHMSLGAWITSYLYMPLIRNYGKVYISIFVAFVIIGFWHEYSVNYLVWGVGHGLALSVTQWFKRSRNRAKTSSAKNKGELTTMHLVKNRGLAIVFCVLTISYVSVLSTFANSGDLQNGLVYLGHFLTF